MMQQRGIALLVVLWVMALLSLLLGSLAGWVQLENRQALHLRQHSQALLAAEAGVELAVQALADPVQRKKWVADGREIALTFDDTQLYVSLHSENGKLYLNNAQAEDFSRLAMACGASQAQASQIASELEVRRNNGQPPFRLLEEVRQLPSMTQALYSRLLPEITLWSGFDRPDPAFASPLMRMALNLPTGNAVGVDPGEVLVIEIRARRAEGSMARLQVTVLLNSMEGRGKAYTVLRWEE
ncbi:General secretion pathway protein GspK [Pseudomonas savastanoi pv. glycinea]|uniref:General secretion pathway protein GspK n=6 Tax=Pseudomonas savastanoi TaxID=29438 RepID=A0A0P9S3P2_PSESG|nr:type II secretion system protein GspK [Pseudomonas savastanoi]EFW80512.1 general secretion pathway protein GspK, putative [Pseudomonas savastanoi pv. glycinea str. B076]EFW84162.1 general secretion pathway protein GspK, putative [Pseudomonas savastanoi pv. glycinea str. race 4]KPC22118.1 General secretion pathway protein GspK [Pseudomonas savastanoi pv. glycinea]KPC27576.1 General secretion pathway protein GspK [Pseudomonas savastanoi pv. glycinea]KPC42487.1 General secretion pathway protei